MGIVVVKLVHTQREMELVVGLRKDESQVVRYQEAAPEHQQQHHQKLGVLGCMVLH